MRQQMGISVFDSHLFPVVPAVRVNCWESRPQDVKLLKEIEVMGTALEELRFSSVVGRFTPVTRCSRIPDPSRSAASFSFFGCDPFNLNFIPAKSCTLTSNAFHPLPFQISPGSTLPSEHATNFFFMHWWQVFPKGLRIHLTSSEIM